MRCLYCDKRLWNPFQATQFCSELHETWSREEQSGAAIKRLLDPVERRERPTSSELSQPPAGHSPVADAPVARRPSPSAAALLQPAVDVEDPPELSLVAPLRIAGTRADGPRRPRPLSSRIAAPEEAPTPEPPMAAALPDQLPEAVALISQLGDSVEALDFIGPPTIPASPQFADCLGPLSPEENLEPQITVGGQLSEPAGPDSSSVVQDLAALALECGFTLPEPNPPQRLVACLPAAASTYEWATLASPVESPVEGPFESIDDQPALADAPLSEAAPSLPMPPHTSPHFEPPLAHAPEPELSTEAFPMEPEQATPVAEPDDSSISEVEHAQESSEDLAIDALVASLLANLQPLDVRPCPATLSVPTPLAARFQPARFAVRFPMSTADSTADWMPPVDVREPGGFLRLEGSTRVFGLSLPALTTGVRDTPVSVRRIPPVPGRFSVDPKAAEAGLIAIDVAITCAITPADSLAAFAPSRGELLEKWPPANLPSDSPAPSATGWAEPAGFSAVEIGAASTESPACHLEDLRAIESALREPRSSRSLRASLPMLPPAEFAAKPLGIAQLLAHLAEVLPDSLAPSTPFAALAARSTLLDRQPVLAVTSITLQSPSITVPEVETTGALRGLRLIECRDSSAPVAAGIRSASPIPTFGPLLSPAEKNSASPHLMPVRTAWRVVLAQVATRVTKHAGLFRVPGLPLWQESHLPTEMPPAGAPLRLHPQLRQPLG